MRRWLPLLWLSLSACGASVVVDLDTEYAIEDGDPITFLAISSDGTEEFGELPAMCDAYGCAVRKGYDERPDGSVDFQFWLDLDGDDLMEIHRIDLPEGTLPAPDWKDPTGEVTIAFKGGGYTLKSEATLVPPGKQAEPTEPTGTTATLQ